MLQSYIYIKFTFSQWGLLDFSYLLDALFMKSSNQRTLLTCCDMKISESFTNYFLVYGRVRPVSPPLTDKLT